MHQYYSDILDKMGTPLWFDENAVPRYVEFSPEYIADIYADECVLMEIACQDCGKKFLVAMSTDGFDWNGKPVSFKDNIKFLHYGDPPNTACCISGSSMNCIDLKVLQYWRRDITVNFFEWTRYPEFEIVLENENDYFTI